jgi:hypothetical protein
MDGILVLCRDHHGHQLISYQGLFSKVVDKIKANLKPDEVEWYIQDRQVSFDEWLAEGYKTKETDLPRKKMNDSMLGGK